MYIFFKYLTHTNIFLDYIAKIVIVISFFNCHHLDAASKVNVNPHCFIQLKQSVLEKITILKFLEIKMMQPLLIKRFKYIFTLIKITIFMNSLVI